MKKYTDNGRDFHLIPPLSSCFVVKPFYHRNKMNRREQDEQKIERRTKNEGVKIQLDAKDSNSEDF